MAKLCNKSAERNNLQIFIAVFHFWALQRCEIFIIFVHKENNFNNYLI